MSILNIKKSVFALALVGFTIPNAGIAFAQSSATDTQIPTTLPSTSPQEYVRQKPGELLIEAPKTDTASVPNSELNSPILAPNVPQKPLTKAEIAKQIAPNFDVAKNYKRLVPVSYTHLDVYKRQGQYNVIFTRRSFYLRAHAGQISFPGGRFDEVDENIVQTAIREAYDCLLYTSRCV